ncbi:MAG TPA: hypothetical protein VJT73_09715, partial [Polyangiaceae bacterium]|nr:hypothetical protein [Polyangiaceae bacterium]
YQGEAAGAINFATPVATTAAAAKTFTVGSLKPGKSYFFTVRALDEGANQDTNIVERGLSTPSKVSFISVQAILTQRCANACHNSAAPPMGLIMQVGFAYQNLVNKPAVEDQPSSPDAGPLNVDDSGVFDAAGYVYQYRKRILPGDPENSYLFLKITGRPPVGNPMPPPSTGVTLTADEVSTIKNWILQGALSD